MQKRSFSSLLQLLSYSSSPVTTLLSCLQCCNHVFQLFLPCSDLLWITALLLAFKGESFFCGIGLLLLFQVLRMHNLWHVCMSLINWGKRRCQNAKMKCNRSLGSLRTVHQLLAFVYRVRNPIKVCCICWTKLEETPSRCCTSADPAAISRLQSSNCFCTVSRGIKFGFNVPIGRNGHIISLRCARAPGFTQFLYIWNRFMMTVQPTYPAL